MDLINAIILAIIEGITEFLPISSTGHMIIASSLMGISGNQFTKLFTVCIQFGAILSVVVLYWRKFFQTTLDFYYKLVAAVIPTLVLGKLFDDKIDELLERVDVVAYSLIIGGILLLFIDKILNHQEDPEDGITYPRAITIGFLQSIAMIPGVSRSAASIIGGMSQKLTRKTAAEFSFFLAVPTMFAATSYKLLKGYKEIQAEHINILIVGNIVAFIVAMLAIKFFIGFLTKYGFKAFGWYRIILGVTLLVLIYMGVDLEIQ